MTTVAENESGQSVVEFLIVLPILLGLSVLLIRVNTAIQVSIVNQQYARAQTHFLTFNSSVYPSLRLRKANMHENGFNQMMIGVSDKAIPEGQDTAPPEATVIQISNSKEHKGSDENQLEPPQRSKIRIRTTVTLCTQTEVIGNKAIVPLDDELKADGASILAEEQKLQTEYCRYPQGVYL